MTMPHRYVSGAIDLSEVKARAEARQQAHQQAQQQALNNGGKAPAIAPFFTVSAENFESDVVRRSMQVPVVVLVGTSRSADSEDLRLNLAELATNAGLRFVFGYVDADVTPEVAQAFGVQGLPTTIALAAGRPVHQFEGGQPREALAGFINSLVEQLAPQLEGLPANEVDESQEDEDPRVVEATEALNRGDFDAAIAIYEQLIAEQPKVKEWAQARDTAKLLKRLNPAARIEDPIAAANADPDDQAKAFDAADAEVAAGVPEQAFARLIGLMRRSADKTPVRERLIELFALFDATDPRVSAARTEMASALF